MANKAYKNRRRKIMNEEILLSQKIYLLPHVCALDDVTNGILLLLLLLRLPTAIRIQRSTWTRKQFLSIYWTTELWQYSVKSIFDKKLCASQEHHKTYTLNVVAFACWNTEYILCACRKQINSFSKNSRQSKIPHKCNKIYRIQIEFVIEILIIRVFGAECRV